MSGSESLHTTVAIRKNTVQGHGSGDFLAPIRVCTVGGANESSKTKLPIAHFVIVEALYP